MKMLVVDDEALPAKGIKFNLETEGYTVVTGTDGVEAVDAASAGDIDLIVLDLMMPRMDGLEACRRIREFSDVPIIMLTAKTGDMDKLMGFGHGADDYPTKPFNILELKARIRALLRRSASGKKKTAEENRLVCGHISLDRDARNAYNDGRLVELTAKEFDVIELLMRNPNRVYSRDALLSAVWGYDSSSDIRTVDVHIRRLREKLERDPAAPEYLVWMHFQSIEHESVLHRLQGRSHRKTLLPMIFPDIFFPALSDEDFGQILRAADWDLLCMT